MSSPHDLFKKFSESARKVLSQSQKISQEMNSGISTEHILLALVSTPGTVAFEILRDCQVNLDQIRLILSLRGQETTIPAGISDSAKKIIEIAAAAAAQFKHAKVDAEHLLLAITSYEDCMAYQIIQRVGINPATLRGQILRFFDEIKGIAQNPQELQGHHETHFFDPEIGTQSSGPMHIGAPPMLPREQNGKRKSSALEMFGINLTAKAKEGKLDPVIGRDLEIQRVIQILARRQKNNPVLVGDPGVGKTAIVEGLAQKITAGDVPKVLENMHIYQIDISSVVAGTMYRGQFEERMKKILQELRKDPSIIIFIDELHTVVGAGSAEGTLDAANILKPALARGEIRLIGATTSEEYRKYIEKDAALERRLAPIYVAEPTTDQTLQILKGLRPRYEQHHKVEIADEALETAVQLAKRYIQDRFLPDKAIDLIDEAAAFIQLSKPVSASQTATTIALEQTIQKITQDKEQAVEKQDFEKAANLRMQELTIKAQLEKTKQAAKKNALSQPKSMVDAQAVAKVVAAWTGVPVGELVKDELIRLTNLEKILKDHIVGQQEATEAVASAIRRSKTGVSSPNRPLGAFIFLGPTGVGKTELAKVLARHIYGKDEALIKIDMSEFMERHNISRLIGAPPGYVGYEEAGKLTETIRRHPYSVVLFDEIEKAHPEVFNILLQVLEDGYLTDARGRRVNFRNAVIIMTSNIGVQELTRQASIGFRAVSHDEKIEAKKTYEHMKEEILRRLKDNFRPEFLNRIDKVIVFKPLERQHLRKIVEIQLQDLQERLIQEDLKIQFSPSLTELITEKSYDPELGARPIRRTISELIEGPLANSILQGNVKKGQKIKADSKNGQTVFSVIRSKKIATS